jgi:uncharacterized DUF497 family protein
MEFEWDEAKRRQNLAKYGVDLLFAALIFEGPVLTRVMTAATTVSCGLPRSGWSRGCPSP